MQKKTEARTASYTLNNNYVNMQVTLIYFLNYISKHELQLNFVNLHMF
jgi:hypothetical protein